MDQRYEELLQHVQRPGRYIGNEVNAIVKDWDSVDLRIALAFPDVYDVGMSHLGIRILYHILNSQPDILCERVFAPWADMENLLRERRLPITTLETNKPLIEFDLVGFSLSHELSYTNVLNILDMSDIPLRSDRRRISDPLIMAGGPCAFNPEPISKFIDLFMIGDGEEAILEISRRYSSFVKKGKHGISRKGLLKELAGIEGVYVPSFYDAIYEGSDFRKLAPAEREAPVIIKKRFTANLDDSFYPTKQILSYVPLVHDRISLEVMRGCPHRCRFCQASTLYSPRRLRSKDTVINLAREAQKNTGHSEISLLSLSTGDYPDIIEVLRDMAKEFKPKGVNVSLPSLRIGKDTKFLPPLVGKMKKTGFTFAPEVGSDKLRRFINKNIDSGDLTEGIKIAYQLGWSRIKLYFMVGFPGEDTEDLDALIAIARSAADIRPANMRRGAKITLSISPFIPKPHTPFQWEPMASHGSLTGKIDYIKRNIKHRRITVNAHHVGMSMLEAFFSRGDRRLCDVVETAFLKGARFDNWSDLLKTDIWQNAFSQCGIDSGDYLKRRRYEEPLPWEHIYPGISRSTLLAENFAAHKEAHSTI